MIPTLSADGIRQFAGVDAGDRLAELNVFAEIDSTNSFLMQASGPAPGQLSVAVTANQTAGRGRHGKTWQSPPGSGVCLSVAYTFASKPGNLPALTLALGLGVLDALQELGAEGIELKWPNDLVALDGKLGGILTEVQQQSASTVTVVAGVGVNVDVRSPLDLSTAGDWSQQVTDLRKICAQTPAHDKVAGVMVKTLYAALIEYEAAGFAPLAARWSDYDWLRGREVVIDTARDEVSGMAAGISDDGALLIDTGAQELQRVTSGSILSAGGRGT